MRPVQPVRMVRPTRRVEQVLETEPVRRVRRVRRAEQVLEMEEVAYVRRAELKPWTEMAPKHGSAPRALQA